MKELEEMKKSFDKFMAKAEQTLQRMKGTKEILDKEEKEYLEAVIRPFKDEVEYIVRRYYNYDDFGGLNIALKENDEIWLPLLSRDLVYSAMQPKKQYTLEELGLFEGEIK